MKVCMVATSVYELDNRVQREARVLVTAGHQVTVVCLGQPSQQQSLEGVRVIRCQPAIAQPAWKLPPWKFVAYVRHLLTLGTATQVRLYTTMVEQRADIYHAHDFDTLQPAAAAASRVGATLVYDSHELFVDTLNEYQGGSFGLRLYTKLVALYCRWMEGRLIQRAAGVITVNTPIAELLARRYHIAKPTVIMNCVDTVPVKVDPQNNLRTMIRASSQDIILLYQGGFGRGRGLSQVITSLTFLPTDYRLVLLGFGELQPQLEQEVHEQNLKTRVTFLPPVPFQQLLGLTASADLGVLTIEDYNLSKRFATPNKLFEYLMAGLPMVSSDLPVLRQIVGDHRVGRLLPSLKPQDIAEAIMTTVTAPDYPDMRQRCIRLAHDTYNWGHESAKLVELYKTL